MASVFAPREYQQQAMEFMRSRLRGNIFARMGAGKTAIALSHVAWLKERHPDLLPVLVLGPKRVVESVWTQEAEKWEHTRDLRIEVVSGPPGRRVKVLGLPADVYCINYENLPWLVGQGDWRWRTVIADESVRLKGFRLRGRGSRRAAAIAKVAHSKVLSWWNLTGTPQPNGLEDLWGQQWFVDRGAALGRTFGDFQLRFFQQVSQYLWSPLPYADAVIGELMSSSTMVIDPRPTLGALPLERVVVEVDLPPEARSFYERMRDEMVAEIEGGLITAANAAVRSLKLVQVASGCVYADDGSVHDVHSEKLEALRSIYEENGEPLIVCYSFRHEADRILSSFPGARKFSGASDVSDWNAGKVRMLLLHPASAGHGLNLQHGGRLMVFYSLTWNAEHHDQAIERIGPSRQAQSGYDRQVVVYYIEARHTMDAIVRSAVENKRRAEEVLLDWVKGSGSHGRH